MFYPSRITMICKICMQSLKLHWNILSNSSFFFPECGLPIRQNTWPWWSHPMCMLFEYGYALVILTTILCIDSSVFSAALCWSQQCLQQPKIWWSAIKRVSNNSIFKFWSFNKEVSWTSWNEDIWDVFYTYVFFHSDSLNGKKTQKIVQNEDAARPSILHKRYFNWFYICLPCKLLFQLCCPW